MKPESQRIAIAEACGWVRDLSRRTVWKKHGKFVATKTDHLPNYLADLNAMHEAVSIFDYDQAEEFYDHLCDICKRANDLLDNPAPWRFAVINATAAQFAEAFLRTLGKWDEL